MTGMFPVIILAGGLATRLRPLTESIPKALILVNQIPFVSLQLKRLKAQNIKHIIFCLGYKGEMIEAYLKNQNNKNLKIEFFYDGDVLLGTAGAIRKIYHKLSPYFFVMYGDSYLLCSFLSVQKAFIKSQKKGLMTIYKNSNRWDKSNIAYEKGKILSYDKEKQTPKMHHIDYGLSVFSKEAFKHLPLDHSFDLATLYKDLIQSDHLAAYETKKRFYEIGSFSGIEELSNHMR